MQEIEKQTGDAEVEHRSAGQRLIADTAKAAYEEYQRVSRPFEEIRKIDARSSARERHSRNHQKHTYRVRVKAERFLLRYSRLLKARWRDCVELAAGLDLLHTSRVDSGCYDS